MSSPAANQNLTPSRSRDLSVSSSSSQRSSAAAVGSSATSSPATGRGGGLTLDGNQNGSAFHQPTANNHVQSNPSAGGYQNDIFNKTKSKLSDSPLKAYSLDTGPGGKVCRVASCCCCCLCYRSIDLFELDRRMCRLGTY